jgi:hypothetical protein
LHHTFPKVVAENNNITIDKRAADEKSLSNDVDKMVLGSSYSSSSKIKNELLSCCPTTEERGELMEEDLNRNKRGGFGGGFKLLVLLHSSSGKSLLFASYFSSSVDHSGAYINGA